jgi:hypothetical protein
MNLWPVFYRGSTRMPTCWRVGLRLQFLQECRQAEEFLQEPSGRRLANFVWLQASLPRTTKDKPAYCYTPITNSKKIFSRTPKCYLRQSWAHDPEDPKNDPLVHACKHRANWKPSLIVSVGHLSWSMVGLLALTRQKQLAKSRHRVSQPASQH